MRQDDQRCKGPVRAVDASANPDDFLERLRSAPLEELSERLASLTQQERVILGLIVRGECNKDIGKTLGIEVTTTKVHASRIFRKLAVKNRVQAAVLQLWSLLLSESYAPAVRQLGSHALSAAAADHDGSQRQGVLQREMRAGASQ